MKVNNDMSNVIEADVRAENQECSTNTVTRPPIDGLPAELLSYILQIFFAELKPGWTRRGSKRDIIPLTHICQKWRSIALATNTLWNQIDLSFPQLVAVLLERSGESPIQVWYFSVRNSARVSPNEIRRIWVQLLPLSHRITSIEVDVTDRSELDGGTMSEKHRSILEPLEDPGIPWPNLDTLILRLVPAKMHRLITLNFHALAPRLKNLTLARIRIPFTSPIYGVHLRHLWLSGTKFAFEELLDALKSCLCLQKLAFYLVRIAPGAYERYEQLTLPSLKTIVVLDMLYDEVYPILRYLEIPNAFWHLMLHVPAMVETIDELFPQNHKVLSRLRQLSVLVFDISQGSATINRNNLLSPRPSHEFDEPIFRSNDADWIDIASYGVLTPPADYLNMLSRSLGGSNCQELTVICYVDLQSLPLTKTVWQSSLIFFPRLEVLRVENSSHGFVAKMLVEAMRALISENMPRLLVLAVEFFGVLDKDGADEWYEIAGHLRVLCTQGRKLSELQLVGKRHNPSNPWELPGSFTNSGRNMVESLLSPHVDKFTISQ